jgi:hypothetical protein
MRKPHLSGAAECEFHLVVVKFFPNELEEVLRFRA